MVYFGGRRMGKEEIGKQIDSKKFSKTMRCYGDDKLGNIIKEIDELGNCYQYTYDDRGKVTSVTDPLNNITKVSK